MAKLKRILLHRTALGVLLLCTAWIGFASYQWFAAPSRIEPRLAAAMEREPYIGRIAVTLDFQPEDFHINYLQRYGIVAGVQGHTVYLVQTRVDRLWKMAELYWIHEIKLAS